MDENEENLIESLVDEVMEDLNIAETVRESDDSDEEKNKTYDYYRRAVKERIQKAYERGFESGSRTYGSFVDD